MTDQAGAPPGGPAISTRRFDAGEAADLDSFLTGNDWPYHSGPTPSPGQVAERVAAGDYGSAGVETWWVEVAGRTVGLVRLFDLDDDTAMFDLRIASGERGRGIGTQAVRWLTGYIGDSRSCARIEATTRQDNQAMRHVLLRCGYVKEAHYRQGWPAVDGTRHDAVGYATLRTDWSSGTTTPVDWTA